MRLQDLCLSLRASIQDLQKFDPSLKECGEAFPGWVDDWSGKAFSLVYTSFGADPAPAAGKSATGLKGRFLGATENRSCRLNYQQTVDTVEKIFDQVLATHGRDKLVAVLAQRTEVKLWGNQFVPMMKSAGFKFKDEQRFDKILTLAQQKAEDPRPGRTL